MNAPSSSAVRRGLASAALWVAALCLPACASEVVCAGNGRNDECVARGGTLEAVGTAAAAGALWVGAGGCRIQGCLPPYHCNALTERCELQRCGEGQPPCPPPYECSDEGSGVCR